MHSNLKLLPLAMVEPHCLDYCTKVGLIVSFSELCSNIHQYVLYILKKYVRIVFTEGLYMLTPCQAHILQISFKDIAPDG